MSQTIRKTAAILAIGDELLSGRTRDANIHFLAGWLADRGIALQEARIVADNQSAIIAAVRMLSSECDYLFTSGGIGPTHDDITAEAIAAAFQVSCPIRDDAREVLEQWYGPRGEDVTSSRLRMARIPEGASLIVNPVSGAPGFQLKNVFVLAGVPGVLHGMMADIEHRVERGPADYVVTVTGQAKESQLSAGLESIEQALFGVSIGSYPGKTGTGGPVSIVVKSLHPALAEQAAAAVVALFRSLGSDAEVLHSQASSESVS